MVVSRTMNPKRTGVRFPPAPQYAKSIYNLGDLNDFQHQGKTWKYSKDIEDNRKVGIHNLILKQTSCSEENLVQLLYGRP